ncbi:MAG: PQQ-binding-like beta-propeller repeat protein, partial [Longimicrobiales bacterium]
MQVSVNLGTTLAALVLVCACGPAPRPGPLLPEASDVAGTLPAAPQLAWRNDIGGGLVSALHARGNGLFATTTNRTVVALAKDSGRRYWQRRVDDAISTGALVANGRVYIATEGLRGAAYAFDATNGRRIWSRTIGPVRVAPLLLGQRLYFATDGGRLYSLNAATGVVEWLTEFGAGLVLPPLSVGNTLVTATAADSVYAISRSDGTFTLRMALPATPSAPGLLRGDTLVLPLHNGVVLGLDTRTLR